MGVWLVKSGSFKLFSSSAKLRVAAFTDGACSKFGFPLDGWNRPVLPGLVRRFAAHLALSPTGAPERSAAIRITPAGTRVLLPLPAARRRVARDRGGRLRSCDARGSAQDARAPQAPTRARVRLAIGGTARFLSPDCTRRIGLGDGPRADVLPEIRLDFGQISCDRLALRFNRFR